MVWGDAALHTVPAAYRKMRAEHPNALRLQLLDALAGRVRTRSLRDVLARRGGTFDLKNHALTPIVNLARWGGLPVTWRRRPPRPACRRRRLTALLTEHDAKILGEVFDDAAAAADGPSGRTARRGSTPGDVITMSELSPLNRSLLNDGLREIAAVQRRVGNFGIPAV